MYCTLYYRTKGDAHAMPKYVMPVSQLLYRFACIFSPLHQYLQRLYNQNKKCHMTAYIQLFSSRESYKDFDFDFFKP
jgi:hypothetical protein